MDNKISVIVPCYNVAKYLPNCFKSLENQTYKNFEIIFINDGSKDDTLDILKKYCEGKENCVLVNQQNKGLSGARNAGLKNMRGGEFVYFFDPDDILSPYILEELVELLSDGKFDLATCDFKRVKDGKKFEKYRLKRTKRKLTTFTKEEAIKKYLSQKLDDFCVWDKLYRADILKENNITFFENCRYAEDTRFNFEYMTKMKKGVVSTNQKLYNYVQRKTSLVHTKFNENRLHCYFSLNYIVKKCEENYPEFLDYAYSIRAMVACEMLWYIKNSKYNNAVAIRQIIDWQTKDAKYLKKCKYIAKYRKILIPLVPKLAKLLLKKRLKNEGAMPECMTRVE